MATGAIIFLEGEKGSRFPDANSIMVDDDIPTVLDPATRLEELEKFERESGVRLVVNSHYHVDHVRYNRVFVNAEVVAHAADVPAITSLDENARIVGIAGRPWEDAWKYAMRDIYGYEETAVRRTVSDGEKISLGRNTIRFIHTPGHTPGHMCVEFIEKKAVYLADIDLTPFGPWYGNLCSSVDDFLQSIERLKAIDASTWYTSHEEGIIYGDIKDRLDAFSETILDRERRMLDFLVEPRGLGEIIDRAIIYRKPWSPREMFEFFEGIMVNKHLDRLQRQGLVTFLDGKWTAS